jgi:hypothetical protein
MDGVLADFDKQIIDKLGHVRTHVGQTSGHAWFEDLVPKIDDFWTTIPVMPGGLAIWRYLAKLKPHILSAYAQWDLRSKTEKLDWIKKHLGNVPSDRINIVKRSHKQDFAMGKTGPNILIDDYQKNIDEWRAAGGIGILYKNATQAISALKQYISL